MGTPVDSSSVTTASCGRKYREHQVTKISLGVGSLLKESCVYSVQCSRCECTDVLERSASLWGRPRPAVLFTLTTHARSTSVRVNANALSQLLPLQLLYKTTSHHSRHDANNSTDVRLSSSCSDTTQGVKQERHRAMSPWIRKRQRMIFTPAQNRLEYDCKCV